jgi:sugar lactone lactonase YvrE
MMRIPAKQPNARLRQWLIGTACIGGAALLVASQIPRQAIAEPVRLQSEATSDSAVWNAVVVHGGSIYLAGPRWAGNTGAALTRLRRGVPTPYPDRKWNEWRAGADAARSFVNINALRLGPDGGLWAVDSGSPEFGGDPLPGGAKLVRIDPQTSRVTRVIGFAPDIARPGSYVDDVRFNGRHAYLTDAGNPGIIVLDLETGQARRVLDGDRSTTARPERAIRVDGATLDGPDGRPLLVHADPMELTPDRRWLLFGPLAGPWSRVPTRLLDDPEIAAPELAGAVEPFADLPPTGGTAMDAAGNLYFSDLSDDAIRVRRPDGRVETLVSDPRLHWVDAMFIDDADRLWMPAAQIDRVPLFQKGVSKLRRPLTVWSVPLEPAS